MVNVNDAALASKIRDFAKARDWEKFHTPKNLVMALGGEAGELLAEFQWLTADESTHAAQPGALRSRVADEMADIAIYLIRLADVLQLDLRAAVLRKLEVNETRFPAEKRDEAATTTEGKTPLTPGKPAISKAREP